LHSFCTLDVLLQLQSLNKKKAGKLSYNVLRKDEEAAHRLRQSGELSYNVFDNNKKRPTGLDNKILGRNLTQYDTDIKIIFSTVEYTNQVYLFLYRSDILY